MMKSPVARIPRLVSFSIRKSNDVRRGSMYLAPEDLVVNLSARDPCEDG